MDHRPRFIAVCFALTALPFIAGCDKDEPVTSYSAPKDPQLVTYAVPEEWRPAQINPKLQHAGFTAGSRDQPVSVTVSFLFNDAPSARDLAMNVNRWRGQLGLDPLPPAGVADAAKTVEGTPDPLQRVNLVSDDGTKRTLAYVAPRADRVWFFKATGSPAGVDAVAPQLEAFVRSAKYLSPSAAALTVAGGDAAAPQLPANHPPTNTPAAPAPRPAAAAGADNNPAGLAYALPAGWTEKPNANPMRLLTLGTGGDKPAELVVSRFPGSVGGAALNLSRWRREVGLPPTEDPNADKETPIKVGDANGALLEFTGPAGPDAKKSFVAKRTVGENTWFFKILGPPKPYHPSGPPSNSSSPQSSSPKRESDRELREKTEVRIGRTHGSSVLLRF